MPWNIILSRTGAFISQKRIEFCELLESRVERFYRIFSNDDSRISLVVKSSIRRENSVTEEKYLGELEKAVQREILMKTCLAGVHRDELEVTLNAKPSRIFSSQGESRSLVLAMKLAALEIIESDKGERPLLLLDDVDSELDRYRRRALLDIAFEKDRQIVITGTQLPVLESELASDCLIFEVSGGKIQQKTASQSFTL